MLLSYRYFLCFSHINPGIFDASLIYVLKKNGIFYVSLIYVSAAECFGYVEAM